MAQTHFGPGTKVSRRWKARKMDGNDGKSGESRRVGQKICQFSVFIQSFGHPFIHSFTRLFIHSVRLIVVTYRPSCFRTRSRPHPHTHTNHNPPLINYIVYIFRGQKFNWAENMLSLRFSFWHSSFLSATTAWFWPWSSFSFCSCSCSFSLSVSLILLIFLPYCVMMTKCRRQSWPKRWWQPLSSGFFPPAGVMDDRSRCK